MARDLSSISGTEDDLEVNTSGKRGKDEEDDEVFDSESAAEERAKERSGGVRRTSEEEEEEELAVDAVDDESKWAGKPEDVIDNEEDKNFRGKFRKRMNTVTAAAKQLAQDKASANKNLAEVSAFAKAQAAKIAELESALVSGQHGTIESQIESLESQAKLAAQEYALAHSLADSQKMSEANDRLVKARSEAAALAHTASYLESEKANMAERLKTAKEAAEAAKKASAATPAVQNIPASRKAWYSANSWFSTKAAEGGDVKSSHALSLHHAAMSEGLALDSSEYFKKIDEGMRSRFPKFFGVRSSTTVRDEPTDRNAPARKLVDGKQLNPSMGQLRTAHRIGLISTVDGSVMTKKDKVNLRAYLLEVEKIKD